MCTWICKACATDGPIRTRIPYEYHIMCKANLDNNIHFVVEYKNSKKKKHKK